MHIFIPTLGRPGPASLTLGRLTDAWRARTTLVVQEHERAAYSLLARFHGVALWTVPSGIRIARTRHLIGQEAQRLGLVKMLMLDDDVSFYVRPNPLDHHLRTAPPYVVGEMLNTLEKDLDDYAHVGVSDRNGNNNYPADDFRLNTRYMRVLAYRTEDYMRCEHERRIEVMEDFDINLQMLSRGLANKVWYRFASGQQQTNARGGCSTWRTVAVHNAGAERLRALHPAFVRLHIKTDAGGFGTRIEPVILWKEAADAGKGLKLRDKGEQTSLWSVGEAEGHE